MLSVPHSLPRYRECLPNLHRLADGPRVTGRLEVAEQVTSNVFGGSGTGLMMPSSGP